MLFKKKSTSKRSDSPLVYHSIVGLVVEFVVAIDEARVRFTDDALSFFLFFFFCLSPFSPHPSNYTNCNLHALTPFLPSIKSSERTKYENQLMVNKCILYAQIRIGSQRDRRDTWVQDVIS